MSNYEMFMETVTRKRLASRQQEAAVHRATKESRHRAGLVEFIRGLSAVRDNQVARATGQAPRAINESLAASTKPNRNLLPYPITVTIERFIHISPWESGKDKEYPRP